MVEYYAKGLDLLCIMNLNRKLEPVPEPFRLQNSVLFRVTFCAYVGFITSLPTDSESIIFSGDLSITKEFARIRSPLLYNCFLRDMAFSIVKELHYAEEYRKTGTLFLPTSHVAKTLPFDVIDSVFTNHCAVVERTLKEVAASYGFNLPAVLQCTNSTAYKLAVYLLYTSGLESVPEFNFSVDIKTLREKT